MKRTADIHDSFWSKLRETVRVEGIPYQWKALNDELPNASPSHCMRNFRIASGKEKGEFYGNVFQDSDVAKWLEGVAYSLEWHPDADLEAVADSAIDDIVAAQQPDGYLNTYYILNPQEQRFTNLMDNHELYCAGHMLEAAIAYYQAVGKRKLLDAMIRYVDYIDSVLGTEPGKKRGYPGHPEIELALMRLYSITDDEKHLRLAKYFIDERGQSPLYFEEECRKEHNPCKWTDSHLKFHYYQAGMPLREQQDAMGHAVRALYLYSGMADVARASNDSELLACCHRMWNSIVNRRMYITGGVGSSEFGESFTGDYDLPNDTCYCETCASIALVFFARRMFRIQPSGSYIDVMERALYNGIISGMQLDGKRFLYTNPLELVPAESTFDYHKHHITPERQKWFDCACCPPNIIRLLSSLEQYLFSVQKDTLYIHLYIDSDIHADVHNEQAHFTCRTRYPWEENITLICQSDACEEYSVALRIPEWCKSYKLLLNGVACEASLKDGHAVMSRLWRKGDEVCLTLSMPVVLSQANPKVREDIGKLAVSRGPIVYCLEEADNGAQLHCLRMGTVKSEDFEFKWTDELGGIITLISPALRDETGDWQTNELYRPEKPALAKPISLRWIPYYAWGNRGVGEMSVWIRR